MKVKIGDIVSYIDGEDFKVRVTEWDKGSSFFKGEVVGKYAKEHTEDKYVFEQIKFKKMKESGYYPEGAEFDPRAPYNEKETPKKIIEVEVSLIVSRLLKVQVTEEHSTYDVEEAIKDKLHLGNVVKLVTDVGGKSSHKWKVIEMDWGEAE